MEITIKPAYDELESVKVLFHEYADMLGIDLYYQSFEQELDSLPGKYAPPEGRLYIAQCDGRAAGCVALRALGGVRCEMKRLFVRPEYRCLGIGKRLVMRVVEDATALHYRQMCLDTLLSLEKAVALYEAVGFRRIEPYCFNPTADALYYGLDL